ncbi:hypothetical protein [Spiroplasma endosymbiont of Poecilobothrus nobilitatus]|uniref:hypothetical protein n=1 Tax=Spiroplasma endosymbiont of Poecilobothrus nobilitatus TaxID=1209220 RepID=UPI00313AEA89
MGYETFLERIKHYAKLEIIELKEVNNNNNNNNKQVTINEQTALVIKKLLDYSEYYFNFVENSWLNKKNHQYDNFKRKLYKLLILLFNFFIR